MTQGKIFDEKTEVKNLERLSLLHNVCNMEYPILRIERKVKCHVEKRLPCRYV
jgi:hypothetical protein